MEILLRLAKAKEGKKLKIRLVENYIFIPKKALSIVIFPLPPFLKDPKCKCGNSADFVLEGMTCMCNECLNNEFKGATSLETNEDISIPLTRRTIVHIKFEWSVNGDRWYTLYGRTIKPRNWERFLPQLRTMILRNNTLSLNADYKKETKEMIIF